MTDAQWQDHSGLIITGIKILPAVDREGGRGLVLHLELESPSGENRVILGGGLSAEIAVSLGVSLYQQGKALLGRAH